MAMLAEPRQKKRYNLTPRGKALYEDETRFGTKMLEKMGWSKGKGLGPNEKGNQDFVRVRMRNRNEGLGYEDRDDHWTQHEQEFNGLLKSLNGENNQDENVNGDTECASDEGSRVGFGFTPVPKKPKVEKLKDKLTGISLEEKSKQSKARVHYRKFTKGKDVAQYSEKDLANIFGKKPVETEQAEGMYAELNAMMSNQENEVKEKPAAEQAKEVKPNFGGVQTISTGLSVSDYFKHKMEARKSKQKHSNVVSQEQNGIEVSEEGQQQEPVEIKRKNKKCKREEAISHTENEVSETNEINIEQSLEKRKKRKSLPENTERENENTLSEANIQDSEAGIESKSRKKKKSSALETGDLTPEEHVTAAKISTKKMSKDMIEQQLFDEKPKKNKSKKKEHGKSQDTAIALTLNNVDEISTSQPPKKKKKKDKQEQYDEGTAPVENIAETEFITEVAVKKNKKSKNKEKLQDNSIAELNSSAKEECAVQALCKKSKKPKKREKEATESIAGGGAQDKQVPQPKETSKKNVSEEISLESLTLDELIAKCNSFNVYTVSSFCAEKFRNVDLDRFNGANISQFPGYSYTEQNLQLNIEHQPKDEQRILQLWNCKINKYQNVNPRAMFASYKNNVIKAYKAKTKERKKIPRFHMKSLKRKNVFQPL